MHLQISQFEYTSSILNYVWLSRGIARICRIFVYRLSSSDNRSIKKFVSSCVFKQKKYRTIRHKLYWSIVVVSVRILRDNSLIKSVFFININTHYKNLPTCCILFGYYATNIIAIYIIPLNLRKAIPDRFLFNRALLQYTRLVLLYNKSYIDLIWSLRVIRGISAGGLNYRDAINVTLALVYLCM